MQQSRRCFMQHLTAATAGMMAASYAKPGAAEVLESRTPVNLVSGTDRREAVYNAIKPFKSTIEKGIQGKRVFVKPNNVYDGVPLCATHPDAIRAVLDLLGEITDQQITVAESTVSPKGTMYTFDEYGYMPLEREYNIKFYDLNTSTSSTKWIHDQKLMPVSIEIIDDFLMPDIYWISMAMPKTHDSAIGTAGYKNMIMGSPINVASTDPRFIRNQYEKGKMHAGGSLGFNWNMFEIGRIVRPDFVVIDGHMGMEGPGPIRGTAVEHNIALAGPDVIAVDRSTLECMGIAYEDVGYLQWCANAGIGQGNRDLIDYIGADPADHVIVYKSHPNLERELEWKLGGAKAEG
ncbi:DUF362 domain-containing protein [bacterium]|nr:DUF362 domain-containing protein [bacterium]